MGTCARLGRRLFASGAVGNVPDSVSDLLGRNLHCQAGHPLHIVKNLVARSFPGFTLFDNLSPVVTVRQCFDELLIPDDHVSRRPTDTFFVDGEHVLRTHTSAHQTDLMREGHTRFLVCGDCYRRDEIDRSHYPAFHQIEGVALFDNRPSDDEVVTDLKASLDKMVQDVLGRGGQKVDTRWVDAYFPFTEPSFELEVYYNDTWMELLGCGAIHKDIIGTKCGLPEATSGWAFGIGLERLAMAMFDIPDIRLFWSRDPRFTQQFREGDLTTKFRPYSKYPPCLKDISFWTQAGFHDNDFYEAVREVAGDLVEAVEPIDDFRCPKTQRHSKCYRITYRSMDRNLVNSDVDQIQSRLRDNVQSRLNVELR
ncbi:phenylalanine--tRNA ligase [Plasmodiophora brassicae]|uniref:phenylalanine--tRNA ligase n=1 Tax=Plasmodiophora brassicae TaxID=37360 RepID=A0A3P3Y9T7_PLABS|nr:unnamed protein product [Plasmodiophora brassicae]